MGRIYVLHGSRKQLMAYLQSHPEIRRLSLLIAEDGDKSGTTDWVETAPLDGIRILNGVPLFPDSPHMVPVTVEIVNQLLDEERTSAD
jgi:hypothetical protein